MKAVKLSAWLLCMYVSLCSAACSVTTGQARFWNTLSTNDSVMRSINSEVDALRTSMQYDFSAVFTVIAALNNKFSSIADTALQDLSLTNVLAFSLDTIESKIDRVDVTLAQISNALSALRVNDFGGTWTVIQSIRTTAGSLLNTVISDLDAMEIKLSRLSASQSAAFLGTSTMITSLFVRAEQNMNTMNTIVKTSSTYVDAIESNLSSVMQLSNTIASKVDILNNGVMAGFSGTYTALSQLKNNISIVDRTVDVLNSMSLTITGFNTLNVLFNSIDGHVNTIDSMLDEIYRTEGTTTSLVDAIIVDLVTVTSKVDRAISFTDTLIDESRTMITRAITIESGLDVLNRLNNTISSKLSALASNVDIAMLVLDTVESKIDRSNIRIQTVISSADVLRSNIDTEFAIVQTINSKVLYIDTTLLSVNSKIDRFSTVESLLDRMYPTLTSAVSISTTINSKLDVIANLSVADLRASRTFASVVDTIQVKGLTFSSVVDLLNRDVRTINSTVDVVGRNLFTAESKLHRISSVLDITNSEIALIQTSINTVNSNLNILAIDFVYTWTILNSMNNKASTISTLMSTIQSRVDAISGGSVSVDMSGTFTALAAVGRTFNSVASVLDAITVRVPDVSGTFTALQTLVAITDEMIEDALEAQSGIITISESDCTGTNITAAMIGTTGYTITSPGRYSLSTNIVFVPTAAATAITINASNVQFDMCQKAITHPAATAFTVNGISVSGSVSGVTISNGIIGQMDGNNIQIANGASRISIDRMQIASAESIGIACLGDVTNLDITRSIIQGSGGAGLSLITGSDILVDDTIFTSNTGGGIIINPGSGTIEQVVISQSLFAQNGSHGINMNGTTGIKRNITITACALLINTGAGIRASKVINSIFSNNMIMSNTINGIHLLDAVESLEVYENVITVNTGAGILIADTNAMPCSFHGNIMSLNTTNNFQEAASSGSHSVLTNYARAVAEANNYSIGGGTGPTVINKSIIDQGTGTFGTRPGRWRNISMTT